MWGEITNFSDIMKLSEILNLSKIMKRSEITNGSETTSETKVQRDHKMEGDDECGTRSLINRSEITELEGERSRNGAIMKSTITTTSAASKRDRIGPKRTRALKRQEIVEAFGLKLVFISFSPSARRCGVCH